jgi:hypothetical protein
MVQKIRQFLFPREFRIDRSAYPKEVRGLMTGAIQHFLKNWPPPAAPVAPVPAVPKQDNQRLLFLADVATGLWRMRRNMVPAGSPRLMEARPIEEMRKPFRWLVSVWDALKENGIEIQDHTGDLYDSGQLLKAPAFEPVPGLKEETVIDTIKPSIYLDGKMIQMGEVVVGTPETQDEGLSKPAKSKTR